MNVTTFLSFFKVEVSNRKFASQDVANDDLFFSFDLSFHVEVYKWQAFNAQFLLFKFIFLVFVIRENEFVECLTFRFLHCAILI